MKNKLTKAIQYAPGGSKIAETLGFSNGCYFIEYTLHNIEGSSQFTKYPDIQAGGFDDNPRDMLDLYSTFKEADGLEEIRQ